ncbi:MAG: phosphonopyruvate decarboxylase [Roseburia sp.]
MQVKEFVREIKQLGVTMITGVPDSALKPFCDYVNGAGEAEFCHYVPANEGAAVGIAIGSYLATGKPACVYAQNSGLGNMVNPVTSLANEAVYGIPMLLVIGWRGEPGTKDEPQHKFMGHLTEELLKTLQIEHAVLGRELPQGVLAEIFERAAEVLRQNRQFAFVVKRDFFECGKKNVYKNNYSMMREDAIGQIISSVSLQDVIVSTTGKISREVYEQSDRMNGQHKQDFLTVGGMGHASMIAFGIAKERPDKRVYCLDGDGAALMHMGSLAFLAKEQPGNLVHICLNNEAHESVGGMPTGCAGLTYAKVAKACGYPAVYLVHNPIELSLALEEIKENCRLTFLEVRVSMDSREDLGRPQESALENRINFMEYHGRDR